MRTLLIVLISCLVAFSGEGTTEVPAIPAELQAEIALTELDAKIAEANANALRTSAQSALAKGSEICGKEFVVKRSGSRLICDPVQAKKP